MPIDPTKDFNSVSELKQLDHDNDVNILMGGEGITNRMTLHAFLSSHRTSLEQKRKEFIEFILNLTHQQIIENIRDAQAQINDAVNRMAEVIDHADERINRIHKILQDTTHRHQELNDAIEAKYFEKDTNGQYSSKAVANTIAAYQRRTGEKLTDDLSPDMLILILRSQQNFERKEIVPVLESELVELNEFRDGVQEQKDKFEEENEQIDQALETIDADSSLSDEERHTKKVEILKDASETALKAQMAADAAEAEYAETISGLLKENGIEDSDHYIEHSNNENIGLHQSAKNELQTIKPLLPIIL